MTFDPDSVLDQLTLQEKASLTSGSGFWWLTPVERLGVPTVMVADGPHGLRVQLDTGTGDHVGLGGSLPATCFPTASATASTWDPVLLYRIGEAIGKEARACNLSVVLGPGTNIKRSPLCGRNFEYFSEDPYLSGELALGWVNGAQSQGVGTSLKHYAANNQETERLRVDTQVSERALREIYFPAFERVVKAAQPWTVMCSYNKVNGTSASENVWLLQTVLRDEWGFAGVVVSDWGAVYNRVPALRAGTDLEMPPTLPTSPDQVARAVESGDLDAAVLDTSVRRVLQLVAQGAPVLDIDEGFDIEAHHALAREAAAASIVLLRNETGVLPIEPGHGAKVALVGEFARTPRFQGAGSSQVVPTRVVTGLDALREDFPDLVFAPGYRLDGEPDPEQDAPLRAQACAAASAADVVVMLLGLPQADESEGFDRTHMRLPARQLEVLREVVAANPNVVVGLVNGSTVELDEVVAVAPAVLELWLGGQASGAGLADVLTGRVNPRGRLAETVPHRLQDSSSYLNFPGDSLTVRYGEGIFVGYRGYDMSEQDVAFPFGYGLSYTTFEVSDLQVDVGGSVQDGDLQVFVSCQVANTGERDGDHVVQVYVRDVESRVRRPVRELKGFATVRLSAGEEKGLTVELDQRAFSYWSEELGRWAVEAGEFVIEVGHHSRDLPLAQTVTIDAPAVTPPLTRSSTLFEWGSDPAGRAVLDDLVAAGANDPFADEDLVAVVGNMPLSTLASFGPMSLSSEQLDEAVAEYSRRVGDTTR